MRQRTFRLMILAIVGLPLLGFGAFAGYRYWQVTRAERINEAVETVRAMGGSVTHEDNNVTKDVLKVKLISTNKLTATGMKLLPRLTRLQELNLTSSNLDDGLLEPVKELQSLKTLYLASTGLTDGCLKHLVGLVGLQELSLDSTQISDAGMEDVAQLKGLRWLYLQNTAITDAGLRRLHGLTALEQIYLNGSNVTDSGVADLKKALPSVQVLGR